jgi:hypothetical protein
MDNNILSYLKIIQEFIITFVKPSDTLLTVNNLKEYFVNWYIGAYDVDIIIIYLIEQMNYKYEQTIDGWSNLKLEV